MPYERSFAIERRLQQVLDLIRSGRYSTPDIAEALGVSVPTVSRDVTALRHRGHGIRSERHEGTWRYVILDASDDKRTGTGTRRRRGALAS